MENCGSDPCETVVVESSERGLLLPKNRRIKQGCWGERHTLVLLGFLGFANVYAMRVNMSLTIVAMVNHTAIPHVNRSISDPCPDDPADNSTSSVVDGEFQWDEYQQGIILGSFFWGYIVTQLPGGRLAEMFGARKLLGWGVLLASFFTLATPIAARFSTPALIICRVLMGLSEGVTFPSMHAMLSQWAPPSQRSRMATLIFTGAQFGTVVTMPLSGLLCEYGFDGGWPTVFYFFGSVGVLWSIVWTCTVSDSPSQSPTISAEEKQYILGSLEESDRKRNVPVPWREILCSRAVWAAAVANIGHAWGFYTLLTELPTYMNNMLHFDMKKNSFVSAVPYLVMWLFSIVCSALADWLIAKQIFEAVTVRKIFNTIGQYGPAAALLAVAFSGCSKLAAVLLLTLAVGLSGATFSSFHVCFLEIAPSFAGTLFGMTNSLANICGFAAPYVVGTLVQGNQTFAEWRLVFLIASAVYCVSNTVFLMFASSRLQPWAQTADNDRRVVP